MKVAFVTQPWDEIDSTFLNSSIPIIVYQLAKRLARSCEVVIYSKRGNSQSKEEFDPKGFQIYRIGVETEQVLLKPVKLAYRLFGSRNPTRPYYGQSWFHRGFFLQIAKDLQDQNCDIVHIINFAQAVPLICSMNPDIKIVLHMECEWLSQLDQSLIEPNLDEVDLVIGCSHFITDKIRGRFPHLADHSRTIHNGVDPNKFACEEVRQEAGNSGKKRLLYVGRISPEKGLHVLLQAFEQAVQIHPDLQLDIVGGASEAPIEFTILVSDDETTAGLVDLYQNKVSPGAGTYFSNLQQQMPEDVAGKVFFRGSVIQSELANYYANSDVFIFPSVWHEPFGIPLLEAMACIVPVIATNSGGMPEIVEDGVTGLIVDRGDPTSLAKAIISLIENDDQRRSMGAAGRQRVDQLFSWDILTNQLLGLYHELHTGEMETSRTV